MNYTSERLVKSLQYAENFLEKEDTTPRSQTFMFYFKHELNSALAAYHLDEKMAILASARVYETMIQRNAFLKIDHSPDNPMVQHMLLEISELQYISRYGD